MTEKRSASPQTLAVCSPTSPIVVWHVELSPSFSSERLSGAWLVDPLHDDALATLTSLFSGCLVAFTEQPGGGDVAELIAQARTGAGGAAADSDAAPVVDLAASVAAIRSHIEELKAAAKAEKEKPGKANLTEPRFPKVSDLEVIDFPHVGEAVAGPALGLARGVENLIAQWMAVESQRLRRKYLAEPWGAQPRQIPLVAK